MNQQDNFLYQVAKSVYNQLGYGMAELSYEKAMASELHEIMQNVQTEYHVAEYYITNSGRKIQIADLRIDILIDNNIIIELKTLDSSFDKKKDVKETKEYKQVSRYMKIMDINQGYLINFHKNGFDFIKIQ